MPEERLRVTFLYSLGDCVRWAARPDLVWRIVGRHWHQGTVSTYVQYDLAAMEAPPPLKTATAYEADLAPWEGEA